MTKRNLIGMAILCSVLLAAGACGKKKGDKSGGQSGAAGLVGTWKLNGKKTVEANAQFNKAPEDKQKLIIDMMNKGTVTITKDTMVMVGLGPKQTDKYKVLKDKGKTVVVESTDEKGKVEKATFTFLSDNEIKVEAEDEGKKKVFFATRK
jgi:hypothetical protein